MDTESIELRIGDAIYTGREFGQIVAIDTDTFTVRFCVDKDYSVTCYDETYPIELVERWRKRVLDDQRKRQEELERRKASSTLEVIYEGENVMHCHKCHIWYSYTKKDLTTVFTGVKVGYCRNCGALMRAVEEC